MRADRCRDRYSRWYGGEICVTLDREGAGVVAADLDRDGLAAVEERVRNVGCDWETGVCDVSDQNECRALRAGRSTRSTGLARRYRGCLRKSTEKMLISSANLRARRSTCATVIENLLFHS